MPEAPEGRNFKDKRAEILRTRRTMPTSNRILEERHRLVVELEEVIRRLGQKFAENVEHEDRPYLELEDIRELEEAIPRLEENFRHRNQGPRVLAEELGYYHGKACIAKLKGAIQRLEAIRGRAPTSEEENDGLRHETHDLLRGMGKSVTQLRQVLELGKSGLNALDKRQRRYLVSWAKSLEPQNGLAAQEACYYANVGVQVQRSIPQNPTLALPLSLSKRNRNRSNSQNGASLSPSMAEAFGVVAGAVGLAFQIAKLIADANRLYDKYKELGPNVRKLNSNLVCLKAIAARLDTQSPLVPGEFVNGVPTELIKELKEDIHQATQLVDRMNKSSGIAHKLKKIIPIYSEQIDKVSSNFNTSFIVLTAFLSFDIKDDTTHIRALLETTDKKDKKMSLQLEQIFEDVSRLSTCSKTGRLPEDRVLSTCPKTGRPLLGGMLLGPDLEKDITSNFQRMSSLCQITRRLSPDVESLLDDLELAFEIFNSVLRDLDELSIHLLHTLDETIRHGISLLEEISVVRAQKDSRAILDGIKAYVSQVQQLDDSIKTFIRQQKKLYKDFEKHLLDDSLRLEDFKLDDKFNIDGTCFSIVVDGNCGGKYGGTDGTLFDDILTNLTGLLPDSLTHMEIRLKKILKIHGISRESDGKTEEEVTDDKSVIMI